MTKILPRYPIYVPSKGRADRFLTAKYMREDGVPFFTVIEEAEYDSYARVVDPESILVLPFSDQGSVIPARNWIKHHATKAGHERHWQLDDNIREIERWYKGHRIRSNAGPSLASSEDFIDRYENIAIGGLNYHMFAAANRPPFTVNCHVYSCMLILNSIPHLFRGKYNEDTDICLQVLADGWCTVLINVFLIDKQTTMTMRGGNTDELEYFDDGRLKMARSLERNWPGVVSTNRRYQRPQHIIKNAWRKFDTPLKLKEGIDLSKMKPNEYGLKLKQVTDEVKSEELRDLLDAYNKEN